MRMNDASQVGPGCRRLRHRITGDSCLRLLSARSYSPMPTSVVIGCCCCCFLYLYTIDVCPMRGWAIFVPSLSTSPFSPPPPIIKKEIIQLYLLLCLVLSTFQLRVQLRRCHFRNKKERTIINGDDLGKHISICHYQIRQL